MTLRPSLVPPTSTGQLARLLFVRMLLGTAVILGATLIFGQAAALAQPGEVTIEKLTNGIDADAAPGPVLSPGTPVTWTYVITVTGSTTLYDIIVSDTSSVVPSCDVTGDGSPDGTHIHPGPLDPGQSFNCIATGTVHAAANGTFAASGKVKALDFAGTAQFEDQDPSYYTPLVAFTADPRVSIQSLVNGTDADSSPGPYVEEGSTVIWTYIVTNTGNVPLTSITVGNSAATPVDCGSTANIVAGPIAPGASITCTSTALAPAQADGLQAGIGTVEASAVDPANGNSLRQISASDPSNFTPVQMPKALAFTGPSSDFAIAGALLAMIGIGIWYSGVLLTRRRAVETGQGL